MTRTSLDLSSGLVVGVVGVFAGVVSGDSGVGV